jgi:hypothetical protein
MERSISEHAAPNRIAHARTPPLTFAEITHDIIWIRDEARRGEVRRGNSSTEQGKWDYSMSVEITASDAPYVGTLVIYTALFVPFYSPNVQRRARITCKYISERDKASRVRDLGRE